jgi:ADP-ribose pyrophosphatase YjhB (NUDIX family)
MSTQYLFQYCPKLVIFSQDRQSILFARRKGEAEFDEYWSLIGGKMETTDETIIGSIKREKDEEIGKGFRMRIAPMFSCYNVLFKKKDGARMILPHIVAQRLDGEVRLNSSEYSEYRWVAVTELASFGPKVDNTGDVVQNAVRLLSFLGVEDFIEV